MKTNDQLQRSSHKRVTIAVVAFVISLLFVAISGFAQSYQWTTFAGRTGTNGTVDGIGTNALFHGPGQMGIENSGSIYVGDVLNNSVRKISPSGLVTTVAGGPFQGPSVAVDGLTNIYILEWNSNSNQYGANSYVRKVAPDGTVSTFWAGLNKPEGIAADAMGNVYVSVAGDHNIQKMTSTGALTIVASGFTQPQGLAVDTLGNIFVADAGANTVMKITPTGAISTFVGWAGHTGTNDGFGSNALFNHPNAVAVDTLGTIYVTDSNNNTIRRITADGMVTTIGGNAGQPGSADGTGPNALFNSPNGIAADGAGVIYVSDYSNNTIRRGFGPKPNFLTEPQSQTVLPGTNVAFTVVVAGQLPLSYQWRFDGHQIGGATNSTLSLTNVQFDAIGKYSVVVSNAFSTTISSNALLLLIDSLDDDHDGIPNGWETFYGLNPDNQSDATNHPPGDRLTYLQKYTYQLNPLTTDTDGDGINDFDELFVYGTDPLSPDSDGDGLTDYAEIFIYHTNPTNQSTAGDGIPDGWKVQNGLIPSVANANNEIGSSGLTCLQLYQYDMSHTNQISPTNLFPSSGSAAYELINIGQHTNRYYYDREDRLVGAEYSRGTSVAYFYDGNGNPVRQMVLSRSAETNGIPVLWLALHGLTNRPGIAYEDSDNDGWSNYQEWQAGTDPSNSNSLPNLFANSGTNVASLAVDFTPSAFIMATGDLDGVTGDEVVIGADGNPGTNVNALFVLTQATNGWTTQKVNIGPFGITSIAIGQPPGRSVPSIYCGLRSPVGTNGAIAEIAPVGTNWQTTIIANSTNSVPIVSGVITNQGLIASYCLSNTSTPLIYAITLQTNGSSTPFALATNSFIAAVSSLRMLPAFPSQYVLVGETGGSTLGAAIMQPPFTEDFNRADGVVSNGWLQSPNAGNLTIQNGRLVAPNTGTYGDIYRPVKFYSGVKISGDITDTCGAVSGGLRYQSSFGILSDGSISNSYRLFFGRSDPNYSNSTVNLYDRNSLVQSAASTFQFSGTLHVDFTMRLDGSVAGSVSGTGGSFNFSFPPRAIVSNGTNFIFEEQGSTLCQPQTLDNLSIQPDAQTSIFTAVKPAVANELPGSETSVCGFLRTNSTSGISVCYVTIDDVNRDQAVSAGDRFIVSEYYLSANNASSLLTQVTIPLASSSVGQHYGITCADLLNTGSELLFTAEPDGQIFAWLPAGAETGLQRQLFCSAYSGKTWHSLAGLKSGGGVGLVGTMVDSTNPNAASVIFWPPQSALPVLPTITETAPIAAILPSQDPLGPVAKLTARVWDNEGNASTPSVQYQLSGTTNWIDAAITEIDGLPYSAKLSVSADPGGINHLLTWNVVTDLGASVVTNVFVRARAKDAMLIGGWSVPTSLQVNMTQDSNTNGIPDWWEYQKFGRLLTPTDAADWDGDGFSNVQEYVADTDPVDPTSFPRITAVQLLPGALRMDWYAGAQSRHIVRMSTGTSNLVWREVFTNEPNSLSNSYVGPIATSNGVYQLRFERP